MVILSAQQIREWDLYTIRNKPVSSIDLMESAAIRCFQWTQQHGLLPNKFSIFCGKGNNGGDGLALARLLTRQGGEVNIHILELGQKGTDDFQTNLTRLHEANIAVHYIQSPEHFPAIPAGNIIIDALFGTGLNRRLEGLTARLVDHINAAPNTVIAIDMPSGLLADDTSKGFAVVKANITLSFQCLKLAFMMAENEPYTGDVQVLDIGLLQNYLTTTSYESLLVEEDFVKTLYRPRATFSHKGNFGHAALIAGSYGFMGAAVLSAHACLRSGVGKLTCHIPACGYEIMQTSAPEAMSKVEKGEHYIETIGDTGKYDAIGIGPGLGLHKSHVALLETVFATAGRPEPVEGTTANEQRLVLDADALNVLAKEPSLLKKIPPFSILTPHPTEFDRVFGASGNDFVRMRQAQQMAKELKLIIVVKGHRSFIAMPGGTGYFNSTGNPGMATGGSGDVLTGIITSLLAQRYPPEQAAVFGVYLHGLAGDLAATALTEEAMIASDITLYLGSAFHRIKN